MLGLYLSYIGVICIMITPPPRTPQLQEVNVPITPAPTASVFVDKAAWRGRSVTVTIGVILLCWGYIGVILFYWGLLGLKGVMLGLYWGYIKVGLGHGRFKLFSL